jgi:NAD(P)-dependent dehydrogenase (short-subunit alcohol dehydrogenase family)
MQTADLSGYVCVVTGGRVRIGYQICLKLLRAGATVIATSRWPHDAVLRFAQESGMSASNYYNVLMFCS